MWVVEKRNQLKLSLHLLLLTDKMSFRPNLLKYIQNSI